MNNTRYIKYSKDRISQIINASKIFSHSIQDNKIIIKEFNSLSKIQRNSIIKEQKRKEKILQEKIRKSSNLADNVALLCTVADLNIIASEYNINPATVCLCISGLCKSNEKILVL